MAFEINISTTDAGGIIVQSVQADGEVVSELRVQPGYVAEVGPSGISVSPRQWRPRPSGD